ncbi:MAG: hypothetical protein J5608_00220 [Alphaproteobacteria bacterium]|nr:hypothetical protein [Alphaproteobacteria bacterium]
MKNDVKKEIKKEYTKAKRAFGRDVIVAILAITGFIFVGTGASASETARTQQQKQANTAKMVAGAGAILSGATIAAFARKTK